MSQLGKRVFPVFGVSVLAVALLLAIPLTSNAVPSDKDVRVINTTAEPVPTAAQGTTTISGNVAVTNTPTVNLGGGSISINNFNDGQQPFQAAANGTQNGTNVSTISVANVPAGKRLVIEFISVSAQVPPGQHLELAQVLTNHGSGGVFHDLLIHEQPDAVIGDALFRAVHDLRLYANGGTQIQLLVRRSSGVGLATFGVSISGYLVDI